MGNAIELTLNGRTITIAGCPPNTTLLEFLRGRGLTGSKEGCAEGDCGACTVVVRERGVAGNGSWRAINACIVPVALVAGREVLTVEGVARDGQLHPVQRAMVEHHGSQCGYCTPGFICSLFEGYHRRDLLEFSQLDDQLCGNLCRCTGYRSIREAAWQAFKQRPLEDAGTPAALPASAPVTPIEYEAGGEAFFRPASLAEVLRLLRRYPQARLVAGATELGLDITKRFQKFPVLISLEAVSELRAIRQSRDTWSIGAAATLTEIEEKVAPEFPPLQTLLRLFGSRQIRNRATMGGNLVTASPIGDSAPFLLAHDARVSITGRGPREISLERFFTGYRQTALQEREVLTEILLPRGVVCRTAKRRSVFYKVSKRREMDIATVAACFVLEIDRDDTLRHVRIAFGGVAPMPKRARETEQAITGRKWNEKTRAKALEVLATEFTPISDVRGSADFRRSLVTSLLDKFFQEEVADGLANVTRVTFTSTVRSLQSAMDSGLVTPGGAPHESAHQHVTGEALYVDDQADGLLEVWPVCAPHAHARIVRRDVTVAREMPGVRAVLLAEDIPGLNDVGAVRDDEILLAKDEVLFHGQIVALVVGDSLADLPGGRGESYDRIRAVAADCSPSKRRIAADSFHTRTEFHPAR